MTGYPVTGQGGLLDDVASMFSARARRRSVAEYAAANPPRHPDKSLPRPAPLPAAPALEEPVAALGHPPRPRKRSRR